MIADLQKQLGIDGTLGIQLLIFVALYLWLRYAFFSPFFSILQERQKKTQGLKKEAEDLLLEAEKKEAEYGAKRREAQRKISASRDKIISTARGEAAEMLGGARKEAKSHMEASRESAQRESQNALRELEPQIKNVASLLVEKLTKERVGL